MHGVTKVRLQRSLHPNQGLSRCTTVLRNRPPVQSHIETSSSPFPALKDHEATHQDSQHHLRIENTGIACPYEASQADEPLLRASSIRPGLEFPETKYVLCTQKAHIRRMT